MTQACRNLSKVLESHRGPLLDSLRGAVAREPDAGDRHIRQQLETALSLLELMLAREGAEAAGRQFGAWLKIARAQSPDRFVELSQWEDRMSGLEAEWAEALNAKLSVDAAEALACAFSAARELLRANPGRAVRMLLIGDCLIWDASLQLQILAQAEGFAIEPVLMAQRVGADLRREMLKRKENDFDLVIYSPYTYEFSGEYAFVSSPLNLLRAPRRAARMVAESLADTSKTIDALAMHFECPIYVHTVSGAMQTRRGWRGAARHLVSRPARAWARRALNLGLSAHIDAINRTRDRPIVRIEEAQADPAASLRELGLVAYDAGELHPTRLAAGLARRPYLRAVRVAAQLADKKLIVCDLDNTLWRGTIGEGPVEHHRDRQQILLDLKSRGVILAIASKNDPGNVSWRGSRLDDDDFAIRMINWSSKPSNIATIAQRLNLKPSSFIFLDDRPDERAMASSAIPELLALDPNVDETWAMLRNWRDALPRSALEDRSKMYRERAQREEFLNSIAAASDGVAESFRSLDLRVTLRGPTDREIARVVELINRTNQFNTTTARTTRREMTAAGKHGWILIAGVRDKFGDMGIVGVLVLAFGTPRRITHFVLSCRVFGFGVEDAMLNAVKRLGVAPIHAAIIETPVNGPCRDVYQRNGFRRHGEDFVLEGPCIAEDPSWLAVDDETSPGACFESAAE